MTPFIGSEALAARTLTSHALRTKFVAVYPDVYLSRNVQMTAVGRAHAAWLWSRRRGLIAGRSAAALHGAKWVDGRLPAQLLWTNRHSPPGVETWSDSVPDDEVTSIDGLPVTTPARTALDIACREPLGPAVAAIDALARATRFAMADATALAQRHRGKRGIRKAGGVFALVDPGAESPRETWLRLIIVKAGFPQPPTQISVFNEYRAIVAVLDMGWENLKIGVEYDGDHHRMTRRQINNDIRRAENINRLGWIHIRVTVEDTEGGILRRVREAFAHRA